VKKEKIEKKKEFCKNNDFVYENIKKKERKQWKYIRSRLKKKK
jgi:NH3-dependent NAD+ synthetase